MKNMNTVTVKFNHQPLYSWWGSCSQEGDFSYSARSWEGLREYYGRHYAVWEETEVSLAPTEEIEMEVTPSNVELFRQKFIGERVDLYLEGRSITPTELYAMVG